MIDNTIKLCPKCKVIRDNGNAICPACFSGLLTSDIKYSDWNQATESEQQQLLDAYLKDHVDEVERAIYGAPAQKDELTTSQKVGCFFVKVLICFVYLIVVSIIQTTCKMKGYPLGAIETILLFGLYYFVCRKSTHAYMNWKLKRVREKKQHVARIKNDKDSVAFSTGVVSKNNDTTQPVPAYMKIAEKVPDNVHDVAPVEETNTTGSDTGTIDLGKPLIKAAFCGQCGKKIIDGNNFCIYCGAEAVSIPVD